MLQSAALLVWRWGPDGPQVLLAHPGGPFWRSKEDGAWTIPKGLVAPGEDSAAAARREFAEETGLEPPLDLHPLSPRRITRTKTLTPWFVQADLDLSGFASQTIELSWPPRSKRRELFAEIDRIAWFDRATALIKIAKGQAPVLQEAFERIADQTRPCSS